MFDFFLKSLFPGTPLFLGADSEGFSQEGRQVSRGAIFEPGLRLQIPTARNQ